MHRGNQVVKVAHYRINFMCPPTRVLRVNLTKNRPIRSRYPSGLETFKTSRDRASTQQASRNLVHTYVAVYVFRHYPRTLWYLLVCRSRTRTARAFGGIDASTSCAACRGGACRPRGRGHTRQPHRRHLPNTDWSRKQHAIRHARAPSQLPTHFSHREVSGHCFVRTELLFHFVP